MPALQTLFFVAPRAPRINAGAARINAGTARINAGTARINAGALC